ncbi:hypothetical protein [Neptuniibacter sp. QD37_11]|uniref:hypothetical protein n=1 Tax=Neptuniibacter sp. QD37_11 TaxID=3398209 RepID=UPI0039F64869
MTSPTQKELQSRYGEQVDNGCAHAIDYLYAYGSYPLRQIFADEIEEVDEGFCPNCQRPAAEWLEPNKTVRFKQYGVTSTHCTACHTLYVGDINKTGIESYRGAKKIPSPVKLGMLTGCGALVTDTSFKLFLNNGYYNKVVEAAEPPFEFENLSAKALRNHIVNNLPTDRYLFIDDFGRKKRSLVQNLKMSQGENVLQVCGESHQYAVNRKAYLALSLLKSELKPSTYKKFDQLMAKYCRGTIAPSDEQFQSFLAEHEACRVAALSLPVNPHERLSLLTLFR